MMGSKNEYEAGHVVSYHVYHTGSDNKDPDNYAKFYLGVCAVLSGSSLFGRTVVLYIRYFQLILL